MKNIFTALIACFALLPAKAQIGYNYRHFDIGAGASYNQVFSDYPKNSSDVGFMGNITYNQTPFINYIAEFQKSNASGSGAFPVPSANYYYTNNYYSAQFRAQRRSGL